MHLSRTPNRSEIGICLLVRSVLNSPAFLPPMLPSLVSEPPKGGAWIHEIKDDGYRTLLAVDGDRRPAEPKEFWAHPPS